MSYRLEPFLRRKNYAVPYITVYGALYSDVTIAPRDKPVASSTVADAMRSVGQKFAGVGAKDPRLDHYGEIDYRLTAQLKSYKKRDAPACRVKPVPILIVTHALNFAYHSNPSPERKAVANLITLAFF